MDINKISAMVAAFSILLSLAVIIKPVASGATAVKVNPSLIEYHENAVGQQFTVAIEITDVTNLYGFDMILKWNTTFLAHVSHSIRVPRDTYVDGVLWNPILPLKNEVNATGTYQIAFASMYPAQSFNGSGTVFTITFQILYHPVQPAPDANITLQLYSTELSNNIGGPIPHNTQDGTVMLYSLAARHDVAVVGVTTSKQGCLPAPTIGRNYTLQINVTVENQGEYVESFFDVWTELSLGIPPSITVGPVTVASLALGETATLTFNWDTAGVAFGNYTVTGAVETVSGETDTGDNRLNDVYIFVTLPGDINGDQFVNAKDAVKLGVAFGSKRGDLIYGSNADINGDDYCNAKDAVILGGNFGNSW